MHLHDVLPTSNFSGGVDILYHNLYPDVTYFISGVCITLSKDICIQLSNRELCEDIHRITEDVVLGKELTNMGYPLTKITNYKSCHLIPDQNTIPDDTTNILFFRIKNSNRNIDIELFIKLCKHLYDIDVN